MATYNGDDTNNSYTGTADADTIHGNGGNDTLDGAAGNDQVFGDDGNDTLSGGTGADLLDGGSANDTLNSGGNGVSNFDTLIGGAGNDILNGIAGDTIDGGTELDQLFLNGANAGAAIIADFRQLNGGGSVTVNGGTISHVEQVVSLSLSRFDDNVILNGVAGAYALTLGNDGDDSIVGGAGFDEIFGGNGDDTLLGGGGNDTLGTRFGEFFSFEVGNDTLDGGEGADQMAGGAGDDIYFVDNSGDVVIEEEGEGLDEVRVSLSNYTLGANLEKLRYQGGTAFSGNGNGLGNTIIGGALADTLNGLGGDDILDGGAGADTLNGGNGNDRYIIDNVGDRIIELNGQGGDTVDASVTFSLAGQYLEALNLTGTAAINGSGNSLDNRMVGNSAANTLNGAAGNDRLDGGAGADKLNGGIGNDTYVVDNVNDKITENNGEGTDTVEASISYSLAGQYIETLRLVGTANINGTGNGQVNNLYGNSGANQLNGGGGADNLYGGAGNDRYTVDNTGDKVYENNNEGYDLVFSSVTFSLAGQYAEELWLTGAANINGTGNGQANSIFGNSGANTLAGGGGNDTLVGGLGSDTLAGGAGADNFWFDTTLGAANVDRITDFNSVDDTIHLDRSVFTGIAHDGTLDAGAFRLGTTALDADDRILYDKVSGNIYYDPDGSGGTYAAVLFAQVTANTTVTAADFFGQP